MKFNIVNSGSSVHSFSFSRFFENDILDFILSTSLFASSVSSLPFSIKMIIIHGHVSSSLLLPPVTLGLVVLVASPHFHVKDPGKQTDHE